MRYGIIDRLIGPLTVVSVEKELRSIKFGRAVPKGAIFDPDSNSAVVAQLEEYFAGERSEFDVVLILQGTPFQLSVWREILKIPYGETRSYGKIAQNLGKPGAARAVGLANHANPIPIIVPCHRVIGRDGSLTGYGGGLYAKRKLLAMESAVTGKGPKAVDSTARRHSTVSQTTLFA